MKSLVLGLALLSATCVQAQEGAVRSNNQGQAVRAAPAVEGECVLMVGGALRREMPMFSSRGAQGGEAARKQADFSLIKGPPTPIMTGLNSFY